MTWSNLCFQKTNDRLKRGRTPAESPGWRQQTSQGTTWTWPGELEWWGREIWKRNTKKITCRLEAGMKEGEGWITACFWWQTLQISMSTIAKTWKQCKFSSIEECIFIYFIYNRKTVYLCNKILLNNEKEWASGKLHMNGSQNHYTEQKSLATEYMSWLNVYEVLEQPKLTCRVEVTRFIASGSGWEKKGA